VWTLLTVTSADGAWGIMDQNEAEEYERAARIIEQHDGLEGEEARSDYRDAIGWTYPRIIYWRKKLGETRTAECYPAESPSSQPDRLIDRTVSRRGRGGRKRPPRNPRVILSIRTGRIKTITIVTMTYE
jgi:hypothetical protein